MLKIAFVHLKRPSNLPVPEDRHLLGIPPLWALSLASYLKEAMPNIKIKILDNQLLDFKDILGKIKKERFDVVGLSPQTNNYKENLAVARLAKQSGSQVVLGGIHANPLRKEILRNRGPASDDYCVDAVVQQDGEKAFYKYVAGKPPASIKNLVYQKRNGRIEENPVELLNLDDLPLTNYKLVDLRRYFSLQSPARNMVAYLSHRGCLWWGKGLGCIFCCLLDKKSRFKSPKKIWQEIKKLRSLYGIEYFFDVGDDLVSQAEWFREVCLAYPVFENKPKLWVYARPSSIRPETVSLLKKINVELVMLGVESLNQQTLFYLKPGLAESACRQAVSLLAEANIDSRISLILGAPGESKKTLQDTIRKIKLLPSRVISRVVFGSLVPFPGSPAWSQLLKKEKKYRKQDLIDIIEISADWIKHFCKVSSLEIECAAEQIEEIKKNQ